MRYITDDNGYVLQVSFGAMITGTDCSCTEYTGSVPAGYSNLVDWATEEAETLYRWKIVDGELTKDEEAVKPPALGSTIRVFGGLEEIGIKSRTTMAEVAAAMPAHSMVILKGKPRIEDWGTDIDGVALIVKAEEADQLTMQILANGDDLAGLAAGSWTAETGVRWNDYRGNAELYSGSLSSGSTTFELGRFRQFVIVGRVSSSGSLLSVTVPREAITATAEAWMLAGSNYYLSFELKHEDGMVTLTYKNNTGDGGRITGVYGVY